MKEEKFDKHKKMEEAHLKKAGYSVLGFAPLAYLNFHVQLILLFLVLFIIQIPGIIIINVFEFNEEESPSVFSKLQLSKLGYSKPICKNTFMMN